MQLIKSHRRYWPRRLRQAGSLVLVGHRSRTRKRPDRDHAVAQSA